ncbi:zinc carboxypeptidase [Favolaschia claudopus]|uniref:Inactive metallocarboxypeptidase ECM14 n=1 Tax=Favolaschia claudopus TaxID=2862362 RepID=A0AAW0DFP4_9AGAR
MLLYFILLSLLTTLATPSPLNSQHILGLENDAQSGEQTASGTLRRFTPKTTADLTHLLSTAQLHNLDIWKVHAQYIDIYSPSSSPLPTSLYSIPHTANSIAIPNLNHLRSSSNWHLTSLANSTFHAEYHPQSEIDWFMHEIARLHPSVATVLKLGRSTEGREIFGLKISAPKMPSKRKIVILGAQHSREWIATSTALYIIHALVAAKEDPNSLAHLLDAHDFHIIPSPNPDGYAYTWEVDRFWYKNRKPVANCTGIDMTRNWDSHWEPTAHPPTPWFHRNSTNISTEHDPINPCSSFFPGFRPLDAPEVHHLAEYITAINVNTNSGNEGNADTGIAAFLELRSYGQMFARPYSYTCDRTPEDAELVEAMLRTAYAGKKRYGTPLLTGTPCEVMYYASAGNVLDYIHDEQNVKLAFTAYLRDTGLYGFAMPPAWIRPVGEETGDMVAALSEFVAKHHDVG